MSKSALSIKFPSTSGIYSSISGASGLLHAQITGLSGFLQVEIDNASVPNVDGTNLHLLKSGQTVLDWNNKSLSGTWTATTPTGESSFQIVNVDYVTGLSGRLQAEIDGASIPNVDGSGMHLTSGGQTTLDWANRSLSGIWFAITPTGTNGFQIANVNYVTDASGFLQSEIDYLSGVATGLAGNVSALTGASGLWTTINYVTGISGFLQNQISTNTSNITGASGVLQSGINSLQSLIPTGKKFLWISTGDILGNTSGTVSIMYNAGNYTGINTPVIPTGFWQVGTALRFQNNLAISTLTNTGNLTISQLFNGQSLSSYTLSGLPTGLVNQNIEVNTFVTCRQTGVSGKLYVYSEISPSYFMDQVSSLNQGPITLTGLFNLAIPTTGDATVSSTYSSGDLSFNASLSFVERVDLVGESAGGVTLDQLTGVSGYLQNEIDIVSGLASAGGSYISQEITGAFDQDLIQGVKSVVMNYASGPNFTLTLPFASGYELGQSILFIKNFVYTDPCPSIISNSGDLLNGNTSAINLWATSQGAQPILVNRVSGGWNIESNLAINGYVNCLGLFSNQGTWAFYQNQFTLNQDSTIAFGPHYANYGHDVGISHDFLLPGVMELNSALPVRYGGTFTSLHGSSFIFEPSGLPVSGLSSGEMRFDGTGFYGWDGNIWRALDNRYLWQATGDVYVNSTSPTSLMSQSGAFSGIGSPVIPVLFWNKGSIFKLSTSLFYQSNAVRTNALFDVYLNSTKVKSFNLSSLATGASFPLQINVNVICRDIIAGSGQIYVDGDVTPNYSLSQTSGITLTPAIPTLSYIDITSEITGELVVTLNSGSNDSALTCYLSSITKET